MSCAISSRRTTGRASGRSSNAAGPAIANRSAGCATMATRSWPTPRGRFRRVERWATFDCYGTLIDWNGGIRSELGRLWPHADIDALLERYHQHEPPVEAES